MDRIELDWKNVEREKLKTGTATQIYKIRFRDGSHEGQWYQKLERDPYFYEGADMKELFASEIASVLNVSNIEVELGNDNFTDFKQKTSFSKSFIEPGEKYVEAHSFFPQYILNSKKIIGDMETTSLYRIEKVSYQGNEYKYIISNNIEDLKFYDFSIRDAIEREKVRLQYMGNVDQIMGEQYKIWFQDYILGNKDRSAKNWGLIVNDSKNRIKSAPCFDNTELFGEKYIHLHGINISPNCMIKYLLEHKSKQVAPCIQGACELANGKLSEILDKYDEPEFEKEHAESFILQRIEIMKNMLQEMENEENVSRLSKGTGNFDKFGMSVGD